MMTKRNNQLPRSRASRSDQQNGSISGVSVTSRHNVDKSRGSRASRSLTNPRNGTCRGSRESQPNSDEMSDLTDDSTHLDQETYEVEEVKAKQVSRDTSIHYLLKWKNHDEMTWEPDYNCDCPQLIDEFERVISGQDSSRPRDNGLRSSRSNNRRTPTRRR